MVCGLSSHLRLPETGCSEPRRRVCSAPAPLPFEQEALGCVYAFCLVLLS